MAAEEIIAQEAVIRGSVQPHTSAIANRLTGLGRLVGGTSVARSYLMDSPDDRQLASVSAYQITQEDSSVSLDSWSGVGVFFSGSYNFGEQDETDLEAGFDFDDFSFTSGVDYRFLDNVAAGVSLGYAYTGIDFDDDAGEVQANNVTLSLYSLWNPIEELGLSGYFAYGLVFFDTEREIDFVAPSRTAKGDTLAHQFELTGNAYYDFTFDALTLGPTARLSYLRINVDDFTEDGAQGLNLEFDDRSDDSLQTGLGGAISYAISTDFGVVVLQGRAEWVHEFLDDASTNTLRFAADTTPSPDIVLTTEDPDRDRALFGAGVSTVFEGGVQAFLDFETVAFHEDVESYTITVGGRLEF